MSRTYGKAQDLIDFTRASSATYLDSDGLLKTASNNIPRIEYDANGNLLGLLVEESRTNLFVHSTVNSTWVPVNIVITENADTSPSGNVDATIVSDGSVNSAHYITQGTAISFTSGTAYTNTVIAKAGTLSYVQVTLPSGSFGSSQWANFDLVNGTVTYETGGTAKISSLGDYFVCSFTATATSSTSGTGGFILIDSPTALRVSAHQGTNATISVYHCQIEQGSFPTSAIPTSGSTATRSADVASLSTSAFGYNQSAGSVVVDYRLNAVEPFATSAEFNDGTQNNRYGFVTSNLNQHRFLNVKNSSADVVIVGSSLAKDTQYIVAAAIKENDYVFAEGGSIVGTDSSASTPIVDTLLIGLTGSVYLNGHIKSIKYYPRRLTNAQLQELTS